mmetsp:Transcript_26417/g.57620  ORF Transcript_26417/g.57620 Transcript_26417/m.57620 type:complete len:244 (+) Transcript_26417:268-999(+)
MRGLALCPQSNILGHRLMMVFLRHALCLSPLVWDLRDSLACGAKQVVHRQAHSCTIATASAPTVLRVIDARHDLLLRERPFAVRRMELRVALHRLGGTESPAAAAGPLVVVRQILHRMQFLPTHTRRQVRLFPPDAGFTNTPLRSRSLSGDPASHGGEFLLGAIREFVHNGCPRSLWLCVDLLHVRFGALENFLSPGVLLGAKLMRAAVLLVELLECPVRHRRCVVVLGHTAQKSGGTSYGPE